MWILYNFNFITYFITSKTVMLELLVVVATKPPLGASIGVHPKGKLMSGIGKLLYKFVNPFIVLV